MATASAKAQARSIGTKILPAASGLRPIDSIARAPIMPMARAGPRAPTPITIALEIVVKSILFLCYPALYGEGAYNNDLFGNILIVMLSQTEPPLSLPALFGHPFRPHVHVRSRRW